MTTYSKPEEILRMDFPIEIIVRGDRHTAEKWLKDNCGPPADWNVGISSLDASRSRYKFPDAAWDSVIYNNNDNEMPDYFFFKEVNNLVIEFKLRFG